MSTLYFSVVICDTINHYSSQTLVSTFHGHTIISPAIPDSRSGCILFSSLSWQTFLFGSTKCAILSPDLVSVGEEPSLI